MSVIFASYWHHEYLFNAINSVLLTILAAPPLVKFNRSLVQSTHASSSLLAAAFIIQFGPVFMAQAQLVFLYGGPAPLDLIPFLLLWIMSALLLSIFLAMQHNIENLLCRNIKKRRWAVVLRAFAGMAYISLFQLVFILLFIPEHILVFPTGLLAGLLNSLIYSRLFRDRISAEHHKTELFSR